MRTVEVFADVACPFTHVGLQRFAAARDARGLRGVCLRIRAWPLELVNGAPLDPGFVAREIADIRRQVAPDLFTGFDTARFPVTSVPAFGLAAAAYDVSVAVGEAVSLGLRHSLFEEGRDIADREVLGEIGRRHDVVPPTLDEATRVTQSDYEEGKRRGVIGSPFFFLEGEGLFCPTLRITKEGEHLRVEWDAGAFEVLLATLTP